MMTGNKKGIKNKITALVLAFCMVLALMPFSAVQASAEDVYKKAVVDEPLSTLTMGSIDILQNPSNSDLSSEENFTGGSYEYDDSTQTLTLTNVEYYYPYVLDDYDSTALSIEGDLNIVLIGDNTLGMGSNGTAVEISGDVIVSGDSLSIPFAQFGVVMGYNTDSTLWIKDATVDICIEHQDNPEDYYGIGIDYEGGDLLIDGGDLTVSAGYVGITEYWGWCCFIFNGGILKTSGLNISSHGGAGHGIGIAANIFFFEPELDSLGSGPNYVPVEGTQGGTLFAQGTQQALDGSVNFADSDTGLKYKALDNPADADSADYEYINAGDFQELIDDQTLIFDESIKYFELTCPVYTGLMPSTDTNSIYANGAPLILTKGTASTENTICTVIYIDVNKNGVTDDDDIIYAPQGMDTTSAGNDLSAYSVYGGSNANLTADTSIIMLGGHVFELYGGNGYINASVTSTLTGNTNVKIKGGIVGNACGSSIDALVGDTHLEISGGTVSNVYGSEKTVTGNTYVTISGTATIKNTVYGASNSADSTVSGNTSVLVSGGTIQGKIYGGGNDTIIGGNSSVTIEDGTVTGTIYGGGISGTIKGNTSVNISGGTLSEVQGGSEIGTINGNVNVNISGGTATAIYGTYYSAVGGDSTVEITGGTITGDVYTALPLDYVTGEKKIKIGGGAAIGINTYGIYLDKISTGKVVIDSSLTGADGCIQIALPYSFTTGTIATGAVAGDAAKIKLLVEGMAVTDKEAYYEAGEIKVRLKTYTVTYDKNTTEAVTGLPGSQTKTHDVALTLTDTVPTRDGYTFTGWNTQASGTGGTAYAKGSQYTENSAATLYAQWAISTYTVTYNANGGTDAPAAQTKTHDVALTLSDAVPTRDGYTFTGWNTQASGAGGTAYAKGSQYTENSAATLYAQWEVNTYAVTYNANGGTDAPAAQTKTHDVALTITDTVPTREGYTFTGWNTQASGAGGTAYAKGSQYTANSAVTLYAQWKQEGGTVNPPSKPDKTIEVTDVEVPIFEGSEGNITAEANVENAFSNSVEVRLTDDEDSKEAFHSIVSEGAEVYPFDISLYIKGTDTKTQPKDGYKVTFTLPLPQSMWELRETVKVAYVNDGQIIILKSELKQIGGVWCIVFESGHFSPYALIAGKTYLSYTYTDIKSHWAYDDICYVIENGIMNGVGISRFAPDISTTRAMIATVLWNMEGQPVSSGSSVFADVPDGKWYSEAISWANDNNIILGYDDGLCRPGNIITREQLAAVLYRYSQFKNMDTGGRDELTQFVDADKISDYALPAVQWAAEEKIMLGKPGNLIDPKGLATRAQVASILHRFMEMKD